MTAGPEAAARPHPPYRDSEVLVIPLLTALALAQVAVPPPATAAAPELPVETMKLDNGLTVLLSRDTRLPVVAVEVRYFVGSAHEVKGRTGFAHLFEHLMFQGSEHYDDEYFKPFEPIGGRINGTTNSDRTNYYQRVPSNYLETVLWMESDRMAHFLPALTQGKLDNQRDVVKNERRQNYEDRPYGVLWEALSTGLYPEGHPYRHLTIGSHADLTAASLDDVKGFFRQYYVPANAVVTIVGDFEPQAAKELVRKYFGAIPAGQRAPTPKAATPALTERKHVVHTDDKIKLPKVVLAWHSPALYADGDAALDVLASVLTDGKTSRLYQPLVYEQKVAKDVSAFQYSRMMGGMFVVEATAAPGKSADEVARALEAALAKALATPPTDDEVARSVNGWRKSFFQRLEAVLDRAQILSNYLHVAGQPDYLDRDLGRYTSLSPADVHAAAGRHVQLDRPLRVDIVPAAQSAARSEGAQ